MQLRNKITESAGFSLLELIIGMSITLVCLTVAGTLLSGGFNVRNRESTRSDALLDAQRAINIMSREIGNSGFGLTTNGIVATDSDVSSIRIRANLNAYMDAYDLGAAGFKEQTSDKDEDIKYYIYTSGSSKVIARYDKNTATVAPLSNRIDNLRIRYYGGKINYTTGNCDIITGSGEVPPTAAGYVVMTVCVQLPRVGVPGGAGYQPASIVQLTSDVTLRNSSLSKTNEY